MHINRLRYILSMIHILIVWGVDHKYRGGASISIFHFSWVLDWICLYIGLDSKWP